MIRRLSKYGEDDKVVSKLNTQYFLIFISMSSWLNKNNIRKPRVFLNSNLLTPSNIPEVIIPHHIDNSNVSNDISDYNIFYTIVNSLNRTDNTLESIPKIAFTFWEGKQFSYLHYLTVKSFTFYNPDFKIIIYNTTHHTDTNPNWKTIEHTKQLSNNIFDISLLQELPNVTFVTINLEDYFPNTSNLSVVHKSDIIRIIKLKEHGGIWFDFDILFLRKVPDNLLKIERNNIGIFKSMDVILIGLIFSHPNNPNLDYLIDKIGRLLNNTLRERDIYQQFGTRIWTKLLGLPVIKNYIKILTNDIVYSYEWNQLDLLYNTNNDIINNHTIGIHWFNGTNISKDYINNTNFNNINPNRSVFNKYIFKVLRDIESKE